MNSPLLYISCYIDLDEWVSNLLKQRRGGPQRYQMVQQNRPKAAGICTVIKGARLPLSILRTPQPDTSKRFFNPHQPPLKNEIVATILSNLKKDTGFFSPTISWTAVFKSKLTVFWSFCSLSRSNGILF